MWKRNLLGSTAMWAPEGGGAAAGAPAATPTPAGESDDDLVPVDSGKVRELTPHERRLRADRTALRQQLAEVRAALEAEKAATKAAQDAQEAAVKRAREETQAAANQRLLQSEIKAAAAKMGACDPGDLLKLLDTSKLTIGEDGAVAGLDEFLAAAKEAKPWAFSGQSPTGQPAGATTSSTAKAPTTPTTAQKITSLPAAERRAKLREFGVRV